MLEIEDFAEQLHIHPTHLSNTIKEQAGTSPCGLYQPRILYTARQLLSNRQLSIREIAYEPSHFTKWFKQMTENTPKAYRANTEMMTII